MVFIINRIQGDATHAESLSTEQSTDLVSPAIELGTVIFQSVHPALVAALRVQHVKNPGWRKKPTGFFYAYSFYAQQGQSTGQNFY